MKVAISSSGENLDSQIDPCFGRCAYFLIVETDDMSYEAFDNENITLGGGAGISSAQFVSSKGAGAVLTGNCGPNAVQTLSAAGVELFINQTGTVKGALERYKSGELRPTNEANVSDHYGIGQQGPTGDTRVQPSGEGVSMGRGMGGGRGMGMGRGRGMVRGMGMSGWNESNQTGSPELSGKQDLSSLKKMAADLKKQMEEIQIRIKKLEKK
jgi:predicted Fe-Mo cluster-binding NifX family protein